MVALRLPGFVAGFSAMFIVVLVAGNAFGPAFGFLLGRGRHVRERPVHRRPRARGSRSRWSRSAGSAWGAGLLPQTSWGVRIGALAAYGFVTGYLFGAVMNLWSWPFLASGSALAWDPGAGAGTNLHHYLAFYVATSFAWDTFRAVGNVALVLAWGGRCWARSTGRRGGCVWCSPPPSGIGLGHRLRGIDR